MVRYSFVLLVALLLCLAFGVGVQLTLHVLGPQTESYPRPAITSTNPVPDVASGVTSSDSVPPSLSGEANLKPKEDESVTQTVKRPMSAGLTQPTLVAPSKTPDSATQIVKVTADTVTNPREMLAKSLEDIFLCPSVQSALKSAEISSTESDSPISRYVASGKRIPILLVTCNRPELLKITLESLFKVKGLSRKDIVVVQDGALASVAAIVREAGLHLKQRTDSNALRGGAGHDGASRIAQHYGFSLSYAFDLKPEAPALVVIEDDLLFSPDFYEYFHINAPLLETDPTTFVISAWNDNGFIHKVRDPYQFLRTEFFPGLGWLLSRRLYKQELESKWPRSHWDHWLRDPLNHKDRDSVYPQVPRDYHNGVKGTFMDDRTHNKYFRDIDYNKNEAISWSGERTKNGYPPYLWAVKSVYRARVYQTISRCQHLQHPHELSMHMGAVVCLWIDIDPNTDINPSPFLGIAEFFGIWHEMRRGGFEGVHEFYWEENFVVLINNRDSRYKELKPPGVPLTTPAMYDRKSYERMKSNKQHLLGLEIQAVAGQDPYLSCEEICSSKKLQCETAGFAVVNSCEMMGKLFECTGCDVNFGFEQPAYVIPAAPPNNFPGKCLVTSDATQSTCDSKHRYTKRLCPCVGNG